MYRSKYSFASSNLSLSLIIFFVFQLRALRGTSVGCTALLWQLFSPQLKDEEND